MHTVDPADTITRLVGYYPVSEQALARRQLSAHLQGDPEPAAPGNHRWRRSGAGDRASDQQRARP